MFWITYLISYLFLRGFVFTGKHGGIDMAALIKCPKCGSNRVEPVKEAGGIAGKMGIMVYLCLNCGKESKIKNKK